MQNARSHAGDKIDATSISFSDFLSRSRAKFKKSGKYISANRFDLPEFQRGFVWKKVQIVQLIEDIQNNASLYIGSIVTAENVGGTDYLVDGQQRFITLSILCSVLKSRIKDDTFLKDTIDSILFSDELPRLSFSNRSLNLTYKNLLNKGGLKLSGEGKFFVDAFNSINKILDSFKIDTDKKIGSFFEKVKEINFIVIKCFDPNEMGKFFVGLNSTGLELSQVELLKSLIHVKIAASSDNEHLSKKFYKTWNSIEKSFKSKNILWFNQFLRQQWYLMGGYVTGKKLSSVIKKKKLNGSTEDLFLYINKLRSDSKIYLKLREEKVDISFPKRTRNNDARKIPFVIEDINKLELQQVYPVLLAMYNLGLKIGEYHVNGRSYEDVKKLWYFLFLAKFSKIVPSVYEKIFAKFCLDISMVDSYKAFKDITESFFEQLKKLVASSKSKFINELNGRYLDNEDQLTKSLLSPIYDKNSVYNLQKIEVEHILPKGKKGKGSFLKWKNIKEVDYDRMASYIFRLGNLTLLEKNLNGRAMNLSFNKKNNIYTQSVYSENKEISSFDKYFNSVNPAIAIEKRGKYLAKKIFERFLAGV